MDEDEKVTLRKVIKEMKNAHKLLEFWLKGSAIEATLADWVKSLENLLGEEVNFDLDC